MSSLTPAELRHLAQIVRAEREVYAEAQSAYAQWLPIVQGLVMEDVLVAAVNPDRASRAQESWNALMAPILAALAKLWKKRFGVKGRNQARMNTELAKYLVRTQELLSKVTKRTYDEVQRIVVEARSQGLSDDAIRVKLSEELAPEKYDASSGRIARTNVMNAYNDGAEQGFRDAAVTTGASVVKAWNAILDKNVRPSHAAANGQTVGVDQYFEVGGYFCQHPGDDSLPAWEAVNCRCIAEFKITGGTVSEPIVAAAEGLPKGWRGPIAALDRLTGDKRWLATPEDGLKTRMLPMTVTRGHVTEDDDIFIGTMEKAWIQDGMLWAEGAFDLNGVDGAEAARLVGERMLFTMSIDPDNVVGEQRLVDAAGGMAPDSVLEEAINTGIVPDGYSPVMVFTDWRLSSVAMVSIPAYDEARIEPVFDYVRPERAVEIADEGFLRISQELFDAAQAAGLLTVSSVTEEGVVMYDLAPTVLEAAAEEAIVASAAMGGQVFKKASFERKATGPTPLTVDEDGSVYGHVRLYGTCYQYGGGQGNGGYCTEPPLSACGYSKFHVHGAKLDDGSIIPVGAITYGYGHESRGGLMASQDHYNNVATMAAKVVASEDEWGVWVCGEVLESHREQAYDLLLSPMSGHWEPDADNDHHLEMLAAHIVVTPGYNVQGRRIVASFDDNGDATHLIVPSPWQKTSQSPKATKNVTMGARDFRRAEALAKRAGVDRDSRAARVLARLNSDKSC